MNDATTPSESPTIARRRIRLALREAREALGLTQSDVAEEMEWSLSKVIRIENGDVSISPNDLRPLLNYLKIKDRDRVDVMMQDAKASRTRRRRERLWWREAPFKDHLTPSMQRLIEFEHEAVAARYFSMYIIPGPLQTRSFAHAILKQWQTEGTDETRLTEEDVRLRLEARMRRRESLLGRPNRPQLRVLLDQSMVWRPYGGPSVLIDQLADFERLVVEGRLTLRLVPFSIEAPLPTFGTFDLLYLSEDGDDDNAVIYREVDLQDEIVEDKGRAAQYRQRFDELWTASMDESDTIDLIRRRLAELKSSNGNSQT